MPRVELRTTALRSVRAHSFVDRLLLRMAVAALTVGAYLSAFAMRIEGPWLALGPLVFLVAVVGAVAWLVAWTSHVTVIVGTDGVYVERHRAKTFVPFAQIERLDRLGAKLTLHARGVPPIVFRAPRAAGYHAEVEEIVRRIEQGRASSEEERRDAHQALLERGDRSVAQWIADMRALSTHEGYRETTIDPLRLWSMVEDGALDAAQRAAAAVALRSQLDTAGKTRLRVAADACASPKVRVALEALAEDDDEELSRALEEL